MNNSELLALAAAKGWIKFPRRGPAIVAKTRPEYWRKYRSANREKVRSITRRAMRRYRSRLAARRKGMWTCPVCGQSKSTDWCRECNHVAKRNWKLPPR